MPTPISYLSGNTLSYQSGMVKKGTIGLNLTSSLTGNYKWWNGVDVTASQYLIYSDTYSTGASSEANVTPAAWSTPDLTDQSLLNLINTLPDRVGQTAFTTLSNALIWLNESGKYFVVRNGYENIVTSGLTLNLDAAWSNSFTTGSTFWYDLSGTGNTGTLTNGPSFTTQDGGAIVFDGTNDVVRVSQQGNSLKPTYFTTEAWVKLNSSQSSRIFIATFSESQSGIGMGLCDPGLGPGTNNTIKFFTSGDNFVGYDHIYSTFQINVGQWYHVTCTYDGSFKKIYINGILNNSSAYTQTIGYTNNDFTVGGLDYNGSIIQSFDGNIAYARMYNRALSQSEILQNYHVTKQRFGFNNIVGNGLVLNLNSQNTISYPTSGTSWYDLTGNNNTGTLTNGPTFDSTTRSIVFDGADDYVNVNYSTSLISGNFTLSSLVYKTRDSMEGIVSNEPTQGQQPYENYVGYGFRNRSDGTFWFVVSQQGYGTTISSTSKSINQWYHLVGTKNGTNMIFYINGTQVGTATSFTPNINSTTNLSIGRLIGGGEPFSGKISMVSYYNRPLSSTEVLQNYYQGNIVTNGLIMALDAGNLVSYPGSGTTFYDISGNNNHCTLYNGITYSNGILTLDGIDDYIKTTNNLDLSTTNAVTILYFLQPTTYGTAVKIIHELSPDFNSNSNCFVSAFSDNSLSQNYEIFASSRGNAGYNIAVYDKSMLNDLKWHHLTIIHDNSQVSKENVMYNNTDLGPEIQNPYSGYGNNNTNNFANQPFYIGSRAGSAYFAPMKVGQILMYNRRLTQSEIIQNFNAHKSRYGL